MIDGGDGNDFAVFSGRRSDYTIVENDDGSFTITDLRTADSDGVDTVQPRRELPVLGSARLPPETSLATAGCASPSTPAAPTGMDFEAFIRGGFLRTSR